ncbi:Receptor-interacting serine/threonine-protein kinase 1 [Tritrichomonas musculus]|uniref:Receptor-interacting serine/threonine-protein kinase 1 n=1 Tax=Tritrichomonas musculus TaxID=1915356 RepID=A0ABR2H0L7_9EUKA
MINKLAEFQKAFNNHQIRILNQYHNKVIEDFTCYLITEKSQAKDLQNLVDKSEITIIDNIGEQNDRYFVIFIDEAIIFIEDCGIDLLSTLFIAKERNRTIIASEKINKEQLSEELHLNFYEEIKEYEKEFYNEIINEFSKSFLISQENQNQVKEIWELILPSFSAYFINKSYKKLEQNKIKETKIEINQLNYYEYIRLHTLKNTNSSSVKLIYHIELGQLFVLKWYYTEESKKLYERELRNYKRICHPSLPRLYGKILDGKTRYLIIEYIRGQSLKDIKTLNLKPEEKINFIFQIMFIIEYLQNESLIYRDLKPNNFIVDKEKRIILIDFDRMIRIDEQPNPEEESTKDIGTLYMAPEIYRGTVKKYTYKEDVYSLGLLIYFIFFGKDPTIIEEEKTESIIYPFDEFPAEYCKLRDICMNCTRKEPSERPKITEVIDSFYDIFLSFMQEETRFFDLSEVMNNYNENKYFPYWKLFYEYDSIEFQEQLKLFNSNENINQNIRKYIENYSNYLNVNHLISQFLLGEEYYPKNYFIENISKFIHFLEIPENSNNSNYAIAQTILGNIYYEGKYILRDIDKAIHYLTLTANQNVTEAQNKLGFIYTEGEYISRDINKGIHYLTLAANQNYAEAQNKLGFIYSECEYISRDINKGIHYLTLAANQNYAEAQTILGFIYTEGEYISRDINKGIHYLTLAANQNYASAQNKLGFIYSEGENISRDINKGIHYFTLAANQNYAIAQFNLGFIYTEGKYISRDINKGIHYLTLAANQNYADAQFLLGFIFFTEKYNHENAKKGRYYFMLASKNRCKAAHFHVGFLYHEGKYVDQDIEKAVHYYKEGSSFNDQYAKNNLGIIYKNGFHGEIQPKIGLAIEYFEEAIRQKNDAVSMYNLSNIYIYDDRVNQNIDKSIELLIRSFNQGFQPSLYLLIIALIKKVNDFNYFNYFKIIEEIDKYKDTTENLKTKIRQTIFCYNLCDANTFEEKYNITRKIEFLYDITLHPIKSNELKIRNKNDPPPGIKLPLPISSQFCEGFGIKI